MSGFELQFTRLDFRKIEDVIDNSQERSSRDPDFLHIVLLILSELRLQEQIGESKNGVHRGPDLMTHAGEEAALDLYGCLGSLFCHDQFQFPPLQLQFPGLFFDLRRV